MRPALTEWISGLRYLVKKPRSLERRLVATIGGLLFAAVLALSFGAIGLLRDQAEQHALARVELAGVIAREEVRRASEDTLTAARLLAARPTLQRLVRSGNADQLRLFLRRFCDMAGLGACAVLAGDTVLAAAGDALEWREVLEAGLEQGERFAVALTSVPEGLLGSVASVPELVDARVAVAQRLDGRLAQSISERAGIDVRFIRASNWLDAVHPDFRQLHSASLASGQAVADRIERRDLFASSTPVFAATGEAVALIEVRLPVSGVEGSVSVFVRRLLWTAVVLGGLALLAALLLARHIVGPLKSLARSAEQLGRGDFSTSIPATGGPEVAALARTMEDMRSNLVGLTATLRRKEAEAQAMLRGVVEGVFAVDADRRIRYLNPQAARMAGVEGKEVIGHFCGDVLGPCAVDGKRPCEVSCPILHAREAGQARATEILQAGDGPQRTVVITSSAMVDGLQVQVIRDETELEAVRRARDAILANISHEFRTPLAAQLASIELLRDGLAVMPREKLEELVDSLQRGTMRLTRLIDNLLESVRIESGQLSIRRQVVPLARVVEEAGQLVGPLLAQRHQALQMDLPAGLPPVNGDETRLVQVFVNLLANAGKFGPEGGRIRLGGAVAGGEVQLWVEDEGPGAPDLGRASIFERFYRAAEEEPEPRGLGLGLWIVKSIVERHGGRVEASRTAEGRTRFTVALPAGAESE